MLNWWFAPINMATAFLSAYFIVRALIYIKHSFTRPMLYIATFLVIRNLYYTIEDTMDYLTFRDGVDFFFIFVYLAMCVLLSYSFFSGDLRSYLCASPGVARKFSFHHCTLHCFARLARLRLSSTFCTFKSNYLLDRYERGGKYSCAPSSLSSTMQVTRGYISSSVLTLQDICECDDSTRTAYVALTSQFR